MIVIPSLNGSIAGLTLAGFPFEVNLQVLEHCGITFSASMADDSEHIECDVLWGENHKVDFNYYTIEFTAQTSHRTVVEVKDSADRVLIAVGCVLWEGV